jgi:hypothetical protein
VVYAVDHAFQAAEEQLETASSYEMFDVHVTHVLLPDDWVYYYFVPSYQAEPHRAFYAMSMTNPMFHFGAALFIQFLDERYGSGDASLDAQLWRASRQDGAITVHGDGTASGPPNEPDLLDAIVDWLETEQTTTLDDALAEFAVWRLLVGEYDDGAHFADASALVGAEVAFADVYQPGDLPVVEQMPAALPFPTGTSFIRVDTSSLESGERLDIDVSVGEDTRWTAQVVRILEGAAAEVVPIPIEGTSGDVLVPAAGCDSVVLAVTNLGNELDGDLPPTDSEFTYSLALSSRPTVVSIEPAASTAGMRDIDVVVTASPLAPDATLDLGAGIAVRDVAIEAGQVTATIDIDLGAPVGPRDVTVLNPGTDPGVLARGFEVLAPPGPEIVAVEPGELRRGEAADLVVTGSSFLEGAAASLGDGITVESVRVDGSSRITLAVNVADSARLGQRDLTITNPGGNAHTLEAALEIVEAADDSDADAGGDGCGCRQAGPGASGVSAAARVLALLGR